MSRWAMCRAARRNVPITNAVFATAALAAALRRLIVCLWLLAVLLALSLGKGEGRCHEQSGKQAKESDEFFHACVSRDESKFYSICCYEPGTLVVEMHKPGGFQPGHRAFFTVSATSVE